MSPPGPSCEAVAPGAPNLELVEEVSDCEDPDGGPTEILQEAPSMLDKTLITLSETKPWRDLALSLVSLNEDTAPTYDFSQSSLADCESVNISCGRAETSSMILKDPRVSSCHFTIRVRRSSSSKGSKQISSGMDIELTDESSNGTWVNDQLVGKANCVPLNTGDRIFVIPSAQVKAHEVIGYVVVALPCKSKAAGHVLISQKENDGGYSGNQEHLCGGPEAARQLVSIIQCRLCEDALIHRCVTAVPCGHNFCCACMIKWCKPRRAPDCPVCKAPVRQFVRNHSVDRIVDTFIYAHPDAARPTESLDRLDAIECDKENQIVISRLLTSAHIVRPLAPEEQAQSAARAGLHQGQQQRASTQHSHGGSPFCVIS